jgi:TatD DNase family protein
MQLIQKINRLPYINIHAHIKGDKNIANEHLVLYNLDYSEFGLSNDNHFYSAGFHPWNIKTYEDSWLNKLEIQLLKPNVIAIGECGLDRNIDIDFALQQHVFHQQILLANKVQIPLIIHSVRSFYDVVSSLQKAKNKMPVIYHGYNNSFKIAQTLIKNNGYISFGKSILQSKNNTSEILKQMPLDKIFLESDESNLSIETIFDKASEILNIAIDNLKQQIIHNFSNVFQL